MYITRMKRLQNGWLAASAYRQVFIYPKECFQMKAWEIRAGRRVEKWQASAGVHIYSAAGRRAGDGYAHITIICVGSRKDPQKEKKKFNRVIL
jgi:hypothetical protein